MNIPLIRPFRLLTRIIVLLRRCIVPVIYIPLWLKAGRQAGREEKGVSSYLICRALMFSHAPYMEQVMIYVWRYWALVNRPIHRFALYLITLSQYSFFVQIQKHRWHTRGRNAKWTTSLHRIFSLVPAAARIIRTSQSVRFTANLRC